LHGRGESPPPPPWPWPQPQRRWQHAGSTSQIFRPESQTLIRLSRSKPRQKTQSAQGLRNTHPLPVLMSSDKPLLTNFTQNKGSGTKNLKCLCHAAPSIHSTISPKHSLKRVTKLSFPFPIGFPTPTKSC